MSLALGYESTDTPQTLKLKKKKKIPCSLVSTASFFPQKKKNAISLMFLHTAPQSKLSHFEQHTSVTGPVCMTSKLGDEFTALT